MRFFLQHWDSSWDTLKALLDRNADDLAVLMHLVLLSAGPTTAPPRTGGPSRPRPPAKRARPCGPPPPQSTPSDGQRPRRRRQRQRAGAGWGEG